MEHMPIIDQLLKLKNQKLISFHVPGHKNAAVYDKYNYKGFKDIILNLDITEIPGGDNLFKATGCIMEAQKKAAEVFKSEETFFLVNGSTAGIYSMIMAATQPGDKILVNRNCHQSVINSIFLGDLEPVYVYPETDIQQGIALGISPTTVEMLLRANSDIKAVVITYPTYEGIACDLKKISDIVHKYDKILLVDEAHGAHLGLSNQLPNTALECGADAVVQSTHKTLPALTQSSMLHIQGNRIDRDKLRFMLRLHQSSSPSYLLMASLDFTVMIYKTKGKQLMEELLCNIYQLRKKLQKLQGLNVLGQEAVGSNFVKGIDPTKLWISLHREYSISGYKIEEKLRHNYNIQMELSNLYGTLAISSIGNKEEDFNQLYKGIHKITEELTRKEAKGQTKFFQFNSKIVYNPKEAYYRKKTTLPIEQSEGYISGEYVIPFPPGIPILIPGEAISKEIIDNIRDLSNQGIEILGLNHSSCEYIDVIDDKKY
ncbi:aminotransferase class I/II-fold pyridoxal phosphate-dependent enzyme [Alkaliphilus pronyensis]|uniref:Aminotransferase class I/II-fold pyridoxal phosphate-dependent enzyme n=1 Tax=Alkaliphilus pronyensis TaxID=1482732 RepID=A0A6I0FIB2_9FIRM|nr:aminotransferase class I/II-fold pyridoxal phosphate-dependent enzyme [Alkaliphilus pronyensis]KAB3537823.1 aminotransferase class I/II-fold pyridoxal phosphate-dependent enzyme [Alkaliphilus pronyensis]